MFLFILLAISLNFANARNLDGFEIMVIPAEQRVPRGESKIPVALERNEQLCTLCEEYSALATSYLNANKTQNEIIETLHQACSKLHSYEQQCVILVDYYAQLFFREVGRIQPEEFCRKVNLCERISLSLPKKDDSCTICRQIVLEILAKLKDPDSELEIIQMLLQECNKMERYAQECKRLVFRYGPLILANGEKFLESTDVCAAIHACKTNGEDAGPAFTAEGFVLDE